MHLGPLHARQHLSLAAVAVAVLLPGSLRAEQILRPRWEIGAGVAALSMPAYRGSSEQRGYLLPVPYAVYRGEVLKVDREKVSGMLFTSERVKLDVVFGDRRPRDIPIYIGATGDKMLELAGELCDGVFAHPVCTAKYVREVMRPAIEAGARRAGRSFDEIAMIGAPIIVTGRTRDVRPRRSRPRSAPGPPAPRPGTRAGWGRSRRRRAAPPVGRWATP